MPTAPTARDYQIRAIACAALFQAGPECNVATALRYVPD